MQTYIYVPDHKEILLHTIREIRYKSFTRRCLDHESVAMVRYYTATYDGKPVMYFIRRGVRYVWVEQ